MSDISFQLGDHCVNLRAGAVIRRNSEVLLCRSVSHEFWYTPGGRIKTGEDSRTALARELREELGVELELGPLLLVGENFFTFRDARFHEVCFYHEARYAGQKLPAIARDGEELHWIATRELASVNLMPPFLKAHLMERQSGLQWVVHRDRHASLALQK